MNMRLTRGDVFEIEVQADMEGLQLKCRLTMSLELRLRLR